MIDFELQNNWVDLLEYPEITALGPDILIQNKSGAIITVYITDSEPTPAQKQKNKLLGYVIKSGDNAVFSLTKAKAYVNATKGSYLLIQAALPATNTGPATVVDVQMASKTEDVKLKLEDIKALLSSLNGNTDLVETLQTQLNNSVVVLQNYVSGVDGLLTSIGNNSDGLESLLDAIGIKNNEIVSTLNFIKNKLPIGPKSSNDSLSVGIATDQISTLATSQLQADQVNQLNDLSLSITDIVFRLPTEIGQKDNLNSLAVVLSLEQQNILQSVNDRLPTSLGTNSQEESLSVTLSKQDKNLFDELSTSAYQRKIEKQLIDLNTELVQLKRQIVLTDQLPVALGNHSVKDSLSVTISHDQEPIPVTLADRAQLQTQFISSNTSGLVDAGFKYASLANTGGGSITITNSSGGGSIIIPAGTSMMIPAVHLQTHTGFTYACSGTTLIAIIGRE